MKMHGFFFALLLCGCNAFAAVQSIDWHEHNPALVSLYGGDALLVGTKTLKFNYSSSNWSAAANSNIPRIAPRGLSLVDGKVLIVGGWTQQGYVQQPEIYDSHSDKWNTLPASPVPFGKDLALAQLSTDEALIVWHQPGTAGWKCNQAFVLNLANGSWSKIDAPDIYCPAAKAYKLASGKVMVVSEVNDFKPQIFDPSKRQWQSIASPIGNNGFSGATVDQSVFIAVNSGGATWHQADEKKILKWDEAATAWRQIGTLKNDRKPEYSSGFQLPNGKLVFFGYHDESDRSDGEILNLSAQSWSTLPLKSDVTEANNSVSTLLSQMNSLLIVAPNWGSVETISIPQN